MYTIEFKKQGLPHCHTLLWIEDKILHAHEVDQYISAELPDPETDMEGYRVVSEMMVHGPCGPTHTDAICMKEANSSKKFPKKYNNETYFGKNGHVHYRRRESDIYVIRRGAELDNSNVVPYNRELYLTFHAHINVEYCGWSMLIKYLFKYISKGTDRIFAKVIKPTITPPTEPEPGNVKVDEIQNFIDGRYICPHDACWRILKFDIHSRHHTVQILCVHLENMQPITFRDHESLDLIVNSEQKKKTTSPNVNNVVYSTFRAACEAMGLLGDDKEWHIAMEEATLSSTPTELRNLFVKTLIFYDVANPMKLWNTY
ncbi:hypothetical protein Tco_1225157 [Tanacetum coccineum]